MRAIAKSDTLALSMELKGFGANTYKNMQPQTLKILDYVVLLLIVVLSSYPFWHKFILR
jgi:energy-coupling factor transport system permease protein